MKGKLIIDWKTVSKQEMFLYLLQNRFLHFYYVDKREVIQFCKFCVDHGFLKFRHQKEFRGTPAEFNVLRDFNIQWRPESLRDRTAVYIMDKNDALILTEHMDPQQATKRGTMNLYTEWRVEADVPTGENRRKYYEWARELLCQ